MTGSDCLGKRAVCPRVFPGFLVEELQKNCLPVGPPVIVPSTRRGNRRGKSVEQHYICEDGTDWTVHTLIDENGKEVEPPHIRPRGPKYGLPNP